MKKIFALLFCFLLLVSGCTKKENPKESPSSQPILQSSVDIIPNYIGKPYTVVNDNIPFFTSEDMKHGENTFEHYADLDSLGRCGVAYASIGKDLMPTTKREPIGMIKPSGWQLIKFDFVDGKFLYNRCHLIGYQLAGENANPKNLITGTRYLNVVGMLPFENEIANYVKKSNRRVLYRVTPLYKGNNLVAHGVLMEARSVNDNNLMFNVFVHNVQPGVEIDYKTGKAVISGTPPASDEKAIQKSIERHKKKLKKQER